MSKPTIKDPLLPNTPPFIEINPLLQLPPSFPKITLVLPTTYRARTGFKYLHKTHRSFSSAFKSLGLQYRMTAFERSAETFVDTGIRDPNFERVFFQRDIRNRDGFRSLEAEVTRLSRKYTGVNEEKVQKWNNQSMDWVAMMKLWHSMNCGNSDFFLYIEDDYVICDGALSHFLSVFQWAEMNLNHWLVIRMTFGFSGLLMQCKDIPTFVKVIEEKSINESFPLDTALAIYWDPFYNSDQPRVHYTYRYILFEHIGYESTVGNYNSRIYQCLTLMKSNVFHYQEQFDWLCEAFMVSPCSNPIVKQLLYRSLPNVEVPLDVDATETLLKRLGLEIFVGTRAGESCSEVCHRQANMQCYGNKFVFNFINSCKLMREKLGHNCLCQSFLRTERRSLPRFHTIKGECQILSSTKKTTVDDPKSPSLFCDASHKSSRRICVCQKKNASQINYTPNKESNLLF